MTRLSLEDQATRFAEDLTRTVQALVPACAPFRARMMSKPDGTEGFTVRQAPTQGITLCVKQEPLFQLLVDFKCSLDRHGHHLAVDDAKATVKVVGANEPIFRYEYDRGAVDDMPAAHIQIHAHRDAITHVMGKAGDATKRGRRRATLGEVGELKALHFPVGGHRFRPCLEDVLEMLVHEFGVDSTLEGRKALRDGREQWRRTQVGSVVRDVPDEAIRVLTDLGYTVTLAKGRPTPPVNDRRLRDF